MRPFKRRRLISYKDYDVERISKVEKLASDEERNDFERDRSRVIHSAAFRRLQGKTQVFATGEGDFFRTRLTHSLEVAQISKGLALRLGANTDLVETISLIHDIGHPPFGHAGEEELKQLMETHGGFEANAQNLRILTRLENKSEEYEGLNLTRAVIDGQLKYKDVYEKDRKKFIYEEDSWIVDWVGLQTGAENAKRRSFECQIMDWADEVAYAVHDLEDGIRARYIDIFTFNEGNEGPTISCIIKEVSEKFNRQDVADIYRSLRDFIFEQYPDFRPAGTGFIRNLEKQKSDRKRLTSSLISRYIKCTDRKSVEQGLDSEVTQRYSYKVVIPVEKQIEVSLINKFIEKYVFMSPQVLTLEAKGRHIIRCLFLKYMQGKNAERLLPQDWQIYVRNADSETCKARVITDYISGMTDNYAQETYARLFLPNRGSIYDIL